MTTRTLTPEESIPPPRAHPEGAELARLALIRAPRLVCMVRDEGADSIGALLDGCDLQALYALVTVLAAMVPDDKTNDELFAWLYEKIPDLDKRRPAA